MVFTIYVYNRIYFTLIVYILVYTMVCIIEFVSILYVLDRILFMYTYIHIYTPPPKPVESFIFGNFPEYLLAFIPLSLPVT